MLDLSFLDSTFFFFYVGVALFFTFVYMHRNKIFYNKEKIEFYRQS